MEHFDRAPTMSMPIRGGVAVITGAASGIGRATALALAARGCDLALVDRQREALEVCAAAASGRGVRVSTYPLDIADAGVLDSLPDSVARDHGRVSILINNAGVSLVGRFEELSIEEFRWLFEINFLAPVHLTGGFLPLLRCEPAAQIVNISSLFGLVAPPGQTAYSASKFAMRGFSEALRHELAGSTVGVTVVHPGGVKTAIATSARIAAGTDAERATATVHHFTKTALRLSPDAAAEQIVRAIKRRSKRLLIGNDARILDLLQRLLPSTYGIVLARMLARSTAKPEPIPGG
jgi:short-subunit dehydrogenase